MGFLTDIFSATVKVALTPLAVAKDAVNVVTGQDPETVKALLESAGDDIDQAGDDLADGNLL
jgi:mannose/fructose-specific phosphotransferase system component IIA